MGMIPNDICISFRGRNYFNTNQTFESYGRTYHRFCEMLPLEEITPFSFWGISEDFFNKNLANGEIKIVSRLCDLA